MGPCCVLLPPHPHAPTGLSSPSPETCPQLLPMGHVGGGLSPFPWGSRPTPGPRPANSPALPTTVPEMPWAPLGLHAILRSSPSLLTQNPQTARTKPSHYPWCPQPADLSATGSLLGTLVLPPVPRIPHPSPAQRKSSGPLQVSPEWLQNLVCKTSHDVPLSAERFLSRWSRSSPGPPVLVGFCSYSI